MTKTYLKFIAGSTILNSFECVQRYPKTGPFVHIPSWQVSQDNGNNRWDTEWDPSAVLVKLSLPYWLSVVS